MSCWVISSREVLYILDIPSLCLVSWNLHVSWVSAKMGPSHTAGLWPAYLKQTVQHSVFCILHYVSTLVTSSDISSLAFLVIICYISNTEIMSPWSKGLFVRHHFIPLHLHDPHNINTWWLDKWKNEWMTKWMNALSSTSQHASLLVRSKCLFHIAHGDGQSIHLEVILWSPIYCNILLLLTKYWWHHIKKYIPKILNLS